MVKLLFVKVSLGIVIVCPSASKLLLRTGILPTEEKSWM